MTNTPGGDHDNTKAITTTKRAGRDGGGRYARTQTMAERDTQMARMKDAGYTYRQIAAHFGIDVSVAHRALERLMLETVTEPSEQTREGEVRRLDAILVGLEDLRAKVVAVLERKHFTVSAGKLIYLGDEPLSDDAPVLQAADRLMAIDDRRIKVQERRARLLGLDIPVRQEFDVTGGVEYRIVGINAGELT